MVNFRYIKPLWPLEYLADLAGLKSGDDLIELIKLVPFFHNAKVPARACAGCDGALFSNSRKIPSLQQADQDLLGCCLRRYDDLSGLYLLRRGKFLLVLIVKRFYFGRLNCYACGLVHHQLTHQDLLLEFFYGVFDLFFLVYAAGPGFLDKKLLRHEIIQISLFSIQRINLNVRGKSFNIFYLFVKTL